MASEVDICNLALNEVGESSIMDLSEDSKAGRLCNQFYALSRDMILRMHPWNFAAQRVELAQLTTTPVFDFDFEFQLPADCLKVLKTDDKFDIFKIEGRKLLSNNSIVKILYTRRVEDTTQFDSLFIEAFYLMLASKIAFNLSDNNALSTTLFAKAEAKAKQTKSMDGQEGITDIVEADQWLNSRF